MNSIYCTILQSAVLKGGLVNETFISCMVKTLALEFFFFFAEEFGGRKDP